jgi:hypothetical protein
VTVLRERFRLTVTAGGLAQVFHRTAHRATPTYTALCEQVRGSPVVRSDETGWRVGGAKGSGTRPTRAHTKRRRHEAAAPKRALDDPRRSHAEWE